MTALGLCEMTFSEKLKDLLKDSGFTLQILVDRTGIKLPTIKSYTRGIREPSFSNAAKIAMAFGKDLNYFFDCDEVTEGMIAKKGRAKGK